MLLAARAAELEGHDISAGAPAIQYLPLAQAVQALAKPLPLLPFLVPAGHFTQISLFADVAVEYFP